MNHPLPFPTLLLVTNHDRSRHPLIDAVRAAVESGVDLVVLREPDLSDEAVRCLAIELIEGIGPERLVLNGRPDLARELRIGLHLREDQSAPSRDTGLDKRRWVGRSVHGTTRGGQATERVDYLLAGNVFETRTHPGRVGQGVDWLGEMSRRSLLPVIGIGGITVENVASAMATGCHGVAVIDAILAQDDPAAATRQLRTALDRASAHRSPPARPPDQRKEIHDDDR